MGKIAMPVYGEQYPVITDRPIELLGRNFNTFTVVKSDVESEWKEPYSGRILKEDEFCFIENGDGEREHYNDEELHMIANPTTEEGYSWAYPSKIEEGWRDRSTRELYKKVMVIDDEEENHLSFGEEDSNAEAHRSILDEIHDTYVRKNADYGDSFSQSLDKFGLVAGVVRIGDKFNRISNLITKDAQVKDESVEDTLLDMANYCIMSVMWQRVQRLERR